VDAISDVRDISRIAYGFMASKVLFAALNLDLFSLLSPGKTLEELTGETGIAKNRLVTLLTACVALGIVVKSGDRYANAPASEAYLVRGAPRYFGDYFRFQVDRQIYPMWMRLDGALRGERTGAYDVLDQEEAGHFTRAQHAGSSGPARVLAEMVDLGACRTLLDVGAGSGAFSIALCQRHPSLSATLIDFPHTLEVARRFVVEAGLERRVGYVVGNALAVRWPGRQDAVLMSYLLSAVAEKAVAALIEQAASVLAPGGSLIVHDFMVDDDRQGPLQAALWSVTSLHFDPDAVSLTPEWLAGLVRQAGLTALPARDVIPGITRLLLARKPKPNGS
jgi:SAM-dependent methyltransferase